MRTVSETPVANTAQTQTLFKGETFSATLSDGREIVIREMKGSDLIYMEEELAKFGETKKSFYLIERLNVGSTKITFEEIADLGIRDIKTISELVAKANGAEEDEEGEDPK
jgi:hypothetical protein